jgi:hypothetical protein
LTTSLSYDGALYLRNIKIVDCGAELLWKILRYARLNRQQGLSQTAIASFETAEDGAKRGGDRDALRLVKLDHLHALSGGWRNPDYGGRLLRKISLTRQNSTRKGESPLLMPLVSELK